MLSLLTLTKLISSIAGVLFLVLSNNSEKTIKKTIAVSNVTVPITNIRVVTI
jgi:hypothetical protein